jgi:phage terminase large subunit-like protein
MKAITLWRRLKADALVAEVNFGGDMVRAVIAAINREVPVVTVHARRAKHLRAEPVAQLYEQGRVHHAGSFPALEDDACITQAAFPYWKTRCATSAWTGCRPAARPTASTRWCGR